MSDYPVILYPDLFNVDTVDRKYGHSLCIDIPHDPHVRTIQDHLFADLNFHCYRIAIWERRLAVVIPLLVLCLGHWGVLYHGIIIVRATWNDTARACIVNQSNSAILKFTFFASEYYSLNLISVCCLSPPPLPTCPRLLSLYGSAPTQILGRSEAIRLDRIASDLFPRCQFEFGGTFT